MVVEVKEEEEKETEDKMEIQHCTYTVMHIESKIQYLLHNTEQRAQNKKVFGI